MRRKSVVAAAVLIAMMVAGLTACSLFPEPPAELVAAAESYADEVRQLAGVKTAEAQVEVADDEGGVVEWRVSIVVDATSADGLAKVPSSVAAVTPPSGAESRVTVRVPAGQGLASVVISDATPTDIERAEILRALPFAASVIFFGGFSVDLVAGTSLGLAVSGVHDRGVLSSDPLDHIGLVAQDVMVEVSATGPSDELVALIDDLAGDSMVQQVYAQEAWEYRARPRLTVYTDDPAPLADTLTALSEPSVAGRPTTEFRLSDGDNDLGGFVGLPLGSAEPDDLPRPEPAPTADPAVVAAQLADDSTDVVEFLVATADSAGMPGTPTTVVTSCTASDTSTQVWGTLLLTVFDHADSATPAYDAIVAAWEAAGYAHTDQATGLAIYTPSAPRAVVELSIRGISEGIEISALGECRG
jgi:hypothetical protein